jgi:hypothetical protein
MFVLLGQKEAILCQLGNKYFYLLLKLIKTGNYVNRMIIIVYQMNATNSAA